MVEKHWKEQWEDAAGAEYEELRALSLEELCRRIARRRLGTYHMIWDATVARGDLASVGWLLFEFLKSPAEYLHRYHCARALLAVMDCKEFEPVDLSVKHPDPTKNLARIEVLLQQALGARPVAE